MKTGAKFGHIVTEETREKIRKALSGRRLSPKTEFKKGQHTSIKTEFKKGQHTSIKTEFKKGQHPSIKTEFKKGQVSYIRLHPEIAASGKDNGNWGGGVTSENEKIRKGIEYDLWRNSVFSRDNWTCQECGERGGKLNAHHIKRFSEYPELRFAIDNGITFCKKCHAKIGIHCNTKTVGGAV